MRSLSLTSTLSVPNLAVAEIEGGSTTGSFSSGNLAPSNITIAGGEPTVAAINRSGSNPTDGQTIYWLVTFSSPNGVAGVDAGDFQLVVEGGFVGASISEVSGSGVGPYTVSATTGLGNGTLGLNITDNDSIISASAVPFFWGGWCRQWRFHRRGVRHFKSCSANVSRGLHTH